jgi:hypothetical protein
MTFVQRVAKCLALCDDVAARCIRLDRTYKQTHMVSQQLNILQTNLPFCPDYLLVHSIKRL